MVAFTSFYSSM